MSDELRATRLRLEAKERELQDIYRSRAWQLVTALRSLKYKLFGARSRRKPAAFIASDDIEPARAGKYDVVCLSTCDWDARFQRPQQLMSRFADAGHRVFYVRQQSGPFSVVRKRANVYEVTLADLDALAFIDTAAMIVQFPTWWPLAKLARERFGWPLIYDCMDLHSGFSTVHREIVAQEEELLAAADVVVVSSAPLERHALRHRASAVMVRNGCDFDHFSKAARPVIGYFGAISEWFDSTLVADLAERRPDWDFMLIGSTFNAAISRLVNLPNVSLLGEEPYESLPDHLARFDVGIIPFKRTPLTEATNPVKVYEMLAAGLPVVSVPIPEVAALVPLVRVASTAEEFEREIVAALADNSNAARDARRAFAREQTWAQRFAVLADATARAIARA